ncbi:MAG: tetratricopeptide repeat protein [Polyangiales bacterium]
MDLGRAQYADENNPSAAIVSWERAIRRNPENAEAHLYLGQALGEIGQLERAETLLRRAVALYGTQSVEDERLRALLAEARNSLGAVLINLRRYDDALAVLRPAAQELTYTSQHLVLGNIGLALLRKGTLDEAAQTLERAVAMQPQFCVGFTRLGELRLQQADATRAIEALDRALAIPLRGCNAIQEAWLLRARAHTQLQHAEQARGDLQRCVEIAPRSAEGLACARLQGAAAP